MLFVRATFYVVFSLVFMFSLSLYAFCLLVVLVRLLVLSASD